MIYTFVEGACLRVAFLIELFHPHAGGCESRFLALGKYLVKFGHEVHVFTIKHAPSLRTYENIYGIHVHRIVSHFDYVLNGFRSPSGVFKYSFVSMFKLLFSDYDFDVIFSNEWPMIHSLLALPFYRDILVQDWPEIWFEKIVFLEKVLGRLVKYHVTVSNFTLNRMINYLKIPRHLITLIPNGLELEQFEGHTDKEWGKIVYVGRFVPHKRIDLLISSFLRAYQKNPNLKLYLAGTGPLLPYFKEKFGHPPAIKFLGYISEKEKIQLLKSAWLFILTSSREGWGISVLESLAAGTPVITVNFPDNASVELVSQGGGIITNPSAEEIAYHILHLYNNENDWHLLHSNAYNTAAKYEWRKIAKKFERFLSFVAKKS